MVRYVPGLQAVKSYQRRWLAKDGLTRTIDPSHFFPTIDAAIEAFRQQTGAHWAADQAAQGRPGAVEQAAPSQPDRTRP